MYGRKPILLKIPLPQSLSHEHTHTHTYFFVCEFSHRMSAMKAWMGDEFPLMNFCVQSELFLTRMPDATAPLINVMSK